MSNDVRNRLIRTVWFIVRSLDEQGAEGKEVVYEALYQNYRTKSLKTLTVQDLTKFIDILKELTGIEIRKASKTSRKSNRVAPVYLATPEQIDKIDTLADKCNMSIMQTFRLLKKFCQSELLTSIAASALIEALKAMYTRGWQGGEAEQEATYLAKYGKLND